MQPFFEASKKQKVRAGCAEQIKKAMADNCPIVFVEYLSYGRTCKYLTDLTKNYNKVHFVLKDIDDGSYNIRECVEHFKLPKSVLKLVGVNADQCVFDTAVGLKSLFSKSNIEVIKKATASCSNNYYVLNSFKDMESKNIILA
jgi:hypothetical protein